jgi:hypothetical protein
MIPEVAVVGIRTREPCSDEPAAAALLLFADTERIRVPTLPLFQHIAEKVHAYTRTYDASGHEEHPTEDLVDILLIARSERLDAASLPNALDATFGQREQQSLPREPAATTSATWREPYRRPGRN